MSADSGSVASVERWLLGDDESFEQLFRRHYRLVHSFFVKRGFTPEEAEDLTQDVFLRVYKGRESFRGEARFTTWLFQICANLFRNDLRGRSAQKREGAEVPIDGVLDSGENGKAEGVASWGSEPDDPLRKALWEEARKRLREALEDLPPQMRRCVELRVYEDLKYREIAAKMGISIDTVKAHLFQARQILREKLGDYFEDFDF